MHFTAIALTSLLSTAYALPQLLARQSFPATDYSVTNLITVCEGVNVPNDCFYTLNLSDSDTDPSKYSSYLYPLSGSASSPRANRILKDGTDRGVLVNSIRWRILNILQGYSQPGLFQLRRNPVCDSIARQNPVRSERVC